MISIALFVVGLVCTCGAIYAAFGAFRHGAAAGIRAGAASGVTNADDRSAAEAVAEPFAAAEAPVAAEPHGAAEPPAAAEPRPAVEPSAAADERAAAEARPVAGAAETQAPGDAERTAGGDDAGSGADTVANGTSAPGTVGADAVQAAPAGADSVPALESAEIFARLQALALGVDPAAVTAPLPPKHAPVLSAVANAVSSGAAESRYAMRRPKLLPQLLHAMHDDETNRRELARIISQDPALVGGLLKLANSPLYRISRRPVESIDRAVAILGTDGIRSLVAAAMMQPVFRPTGGRFASFPAVVWEHTFRSAAAGEAHAAFAEKTDRFAAQLLGLLMGLGALVVFRITRDRYVARRGLRPDPALYAAALNAHTAETARRIAAGWNLSDRILEALEGEAPRSSCSPASLGRSLRFGRLTGALATLHANGLIDPAVAHASLPAIGAAALPEQVTSRLLFSDIGPGGERAA